VSPRENGVSSKSFILLASHSYAVFYAGGQTPFGIAVADIDGDKILDIVIADVWGNQIVVLLGKGDGSFQSPLTYPAGLQPTYVAVADLNHDGLPDVVITQSTGSISA
jgi:hypothetical protein